MQKCLKCLKALGSSDEYDGTGLHAQCYLDYFGIKNLEPLSSFKRRATSKEPKRENDSSWNTSFFHGMFKKYSATLVEQSYIVKVKEEAVPELPDVEYLCNKIGRTLGVGVPDFYVIKLFGERTFLTKNFVRKNSGPANLTHIYHFLKKDDQYDCETLIHVILEQTENIVEAEKFVEMCLFDSLIGNSDRHGRNIGLITTSDGTRLAPIYDNPSALGLESGEILNADWNPTGKVAVKDGENPSSTDYIREFRRLGYDSSVKRFIGKANKSKNRIKKSILESFCSDLMKRAMERLIFKRLKEMNDEVNT